MENSGGEARPPEIAKYSATAADATAAKSAGDGEARPPGIAKFLVTAKSELAELFGELHDSAGPSWPRENGTTSTAATAEVGKTVDEDRPAKIAKCQCHRRGRNPSRTDF